MRSRIPLNFALQEREMKVAHALCVLGQERRMGEEELVFPASAVRSGEP